MDAAKSVADDGNSVSGIFKFDEIWHWKLFPIYSDGADFVYFL